MMNDRTAGGQAAIHRTALHTVFGKSHGLLVSALSNRNALYTYAVTRGIHHDEHVFQAPVFLAHQVAHSATMVAKLQHCSGTGLDTHLVLNAHAVNIVSVTKGAIRLNHEFGADKQADALDALGSALHTGEDQVDNVVRHVVLTPGDEDLGAKDAVGTVRLRFGTGTHSCQV